MYSRVALNFSRAMVALAQEKNILNNVRKAAEELLDALKLPDLVKYLSYPKVPITSKREVLKRLLPPECPPEFTNFLNLIIDRRREGALVPILEAVLDGILEAQGFKIVELISALPLTESDQDSIKKRLEKAWQSKVTLQYRQNPNLIGGIIIRHGDQVVDGSLSSQLNALKQSLIEEVSIPGFV
jgi:F-type H+-transporting ATPase subunit delta